MNASADLCAYPGCAAGKSSVVHMCENRFNHPHYSACHPFQSARETAESPRLTVYEVGMKRTSTSASNRADTLPLWMLPAVGGEP